MFFMLGYGISTMSTEYFYEIEYKFNNTRQSENCVSVSLMVENPVPDNYTDNAYRKLRSKLCHTQENIRDKYELKRKTIRYHNEPFSSYEEVKQEILSRLPNEAGGHVYKPMEYSRYGPIELRITNGATLSEVEKAVDEYFPLFKVEKEQNIISVILSPC